jgi:putative SOS response-associated peptidase YedK
LPSFVLSPAGKASNFANGSAPFSPAKDFSELIKLVGVIMARVQFFAPRYNIAPTQLAPVIYHERHQPAMKLMRWGLIPSWAKDESVGGAHI